MHRHSWFQSSAASTGTWMQQKSHPASGWRCVNCLPAEGWTSHAHFCSNPSRKAAQTASRRLTHRAIQASSPPSQGAGHTAGKRAFSSLSTFSLALGGVATGCAGRSRLLVPPTRTEPQNDRGAALKATSRQPDSAHLKGWGLNSGTWRQHFAGTASHQAFEENTRKVPLWKSWMHV